MCPNRQRVCLDCRKSWSSTPSTVGVERASDAEVQGHPQSRGEFEASLDHTRPWLKKNKGRKREGKTKERERRRKKRGRKERNQEREGGKERKKSEKRKGGRGSEQCPILVSHPPLPYQSAQLQCFLLLLAHRLHPGCCTGPRPET